MKELILKSPAFEANQKIPEKYTCEGEGKSPPLIVEGVPDEAKSLALICEDPDAVSGIFDHWVVWNIPASTRSIEEGKSPGTEGLNTARDIGYHPPCPPSGSHRYTFKIYALDTQLDLSMNSKKKDLEKAMQGHVIGSGELIGLYR
jgi:Raf kinase inhibitor-like YbhB/YbcL family protein